MITKIIVDNRHALMYATNPWMHFPVLERDGVECLGEECQGTLIVASLTLDIALPLIHISDLLSIVAINLERLEYFQSLVKASHCNTPFRFAKMNDATTSEG